MVEESFLDENTFVFCFSNVRDMFEAFRDDVVVRADADMLTGWNIFGFDIPFLMEEYMSQFRCADERLTLDVVKRISKLFRTKTKLQPSVGFVEEIGSTIWDRIKLGLGRINDPETPTQSVRETLWERWRNQFGERFLLSVLKKDGDITCGVAKRALATAIVVVERAQQYCTHPPHKRILRDVLGTLQSQTVGGIQDLQDAADEFQWRDFMQWLGCYVKSKGRDEKAQHRRL